MPYSANRRQQDRKLVSTEPRHGCGRRYRGRQPRRYLLEKKVAMVMAQRVIDVFKAIEVHQENGGLSRLCRHLQRLVGPQCKQGAIAKACEAVVQGLMSLLSGLTTEAIYQPSIL